MTAGRKNLIYALLIVAWLLIVGWQALEHYRVRESARAALAVRGRDIGLTFQAVVRRARWRSSMVITQMTTTSIAVRTKSIGS